MASATLAVEIISHEAEDKDDSGHWKPGRLGKSRHWWNTHVFSRRNERPHPNALVHSEWREI